MEEMVKVSIFIRSLSLSLSLSPVLYIPPFLLLGIKSLLVLLFEIVKRGTGRS